VKAVLERNGSESLARESRRRCRLLGDLVTVLISAGESGDGTHAEQLLRQLREETETLSATLVGPTGGNPSIAAALSRCLVEVTELRHDLREHAAAQRLGSLNRIQHALARLRRADSSAELIEAAPRELCESCDFDRALVSRVSGSTWLPQTVHVCEGADPEVTATLERYIDGLAIPLTTTLLETEQVRRKAPALVRDPLGDLRTFHPLMRVSQTRTYVSAPVMPAGRVIGFVHADTSTSGRELTPADRDNIFIFAEGFGLIFERAVLLERLQAQRTRVRETFDATGSLLDDLCEAEVKLARHELEPTSLAETATRVLSTARDSRITGLLTGRERDVFALMAEGATNGQIAERLVIAEGTVKSHVKHILRKMRVSNRAEAVSRYLRVPAEEAR
jgi:DNA-binding CsgD family transcriptional regulator